MRRFCLLGFSILSLIACSKHQQHNVRSTEANSIVHSRQVTTTDLYAKHTIAFVNQRGPQCSGVIIAPHFVLTAAHCEGFIQGTQVGFGLNLKTPGFETRAIKNITVHPDFCWPCMFDLDLKTTNDLILVEFEGDLPAGFEAVELAPKDLISKDTLVHIVGYGRDENGNVDGNMKVTDKVPVNEVAESEFNTIEIDSGSCNGDSGGPVFIPQDGKLLLAGIVSRGDQACKAQGVYTIPMAHKDWIQRTTAE